MRIRLKESFFSILILFAAFLFSPLITHSAPKNWAYIESESQQETNSTTFVDAATLEFDAANADYIVAAAFEFASSSTVSSAEAKLLIEGVEEGLVIQESTTNFSSRYNMGWIKKVTFAAGSRTIKIQYRIESSSYTAYIRNIHIFAWKAEGLQYAATEAQQNVTTTETTLATLTFTPSSTQDYLILASVEGKPASTSNSIILRLKVDTVEKNRIDTEAQDTTDYRGHGIVLLQNLSNASHTILITGQAESGTMNARRIRIAAIPIGGLTHYSAADEGVTKMDYGVYEDKLSYSPTISNAGDHIIFASSEAQGGDGINRAKYNNLLIDGTQYHEMSERSQDATDYVSTFFLKKLNLSAGSHTFKIQHKDTASWSVWTKNARIVVLQLPDEFAYPLIWGSGFNFFKNQTDVTPSTTGSWQDVDVSDYVPSGATGVILKLVNTDASTARMIAVRKKGSEDDFKLHSNVFHSDNYIGAWIGIDSDRIFEAYIESSDCEIYLIGFTDGAVTFFTNGKDLTPGSTESWVDVDCSSYIPSDATGVIIEAYNQGSQDYECGVRKNGSADAYTGVLVDDHHVFFAIGVDDNQILEAYRGYDGVKFNLIGYTKSPVTFFTNAEKFVWTQDVWNEKDLTSVTSDDAVGAIWLLWHGYQGFSTEMAVRKLGSSDPAYKVRGNADDNAPSNDGGIIGTGCGLNADQKCELWSDYDLANQEFLLIGYCSVSTPTISADADSFISLVNPGEQETNYNFGACDLIKIGDYEDTFGGEYNRRGILRFDLSKIPAGNKVARARLYLYVDQVTCWQDMVNPPYPCLYGSVGIHRVDHGTPNYETDWVEGIGICNGGGGNKVSWNKYDGTTSWGTAGGDFNPTATDSKYIDSGGWYYWDVTADCDERAMRSWILKVAVHNEGAYTYFGSKEYADSDYHPYLEVAYTPTAVDLLSFTATGDGDKVKVEWETAQEIDNVGFKLYRGEGPGGPYIKLNDRVIPGLFSSIRGKAYTYEDTDVTPGKLYYYKLEDIDTHGRHTFHGPICVDWDEDSMPDDWEILYGLNPTFNDSGIDSDEDGLTNLEEYQLGTDPFNPDTDGDGILDGEEQRKRNRDAETGTQTLTKGVQIVQSDDTGITLELQTDAFDMEIVEAQGEAYERLRILDYIHGFTKEVGSPELPIKGIFLDLPEGKSATLKLEHTDTKTYSGYWIYPVPENTLQGEGGMDHVGEVFSIDEAAYSTDAFYPDLVAQLGKTYIFRGQQKLQVLFYPLAFNPATKELMHYTRIRVRVTYEDATENFLMGSSLRGAVGEPSGLGVLTWAPPSENPAYKISVSSEGIYQLTKSFFLEKGISVDGIALSQVRLYNLGEEIAIYVYDQDGDNSLDTGDYIEFYGEPVEAGYAKYARYNIYWLTVSGGSGDPKRMAEIDGTPGTAPVPGSHISMVSHEEDERYWIGAPGGDSLDRWFFDDRVRGEGYEDGGPVDFTLTLSGVAGPASLGITLYGGFDIDHEVDISVNGGDAETYTWSGISRYEATIDSINLEEANTVTIGCGGGLDAILVDTFTVNYQRSFEATNDLLRFSYEAGYRYQILGFTKNELEVFDITSGDHVRRIVNFQSSGSGPYTVEFEPSGVTGERIYLVLSSDGVKTPSGISLDTPSDLSGTANGADYILITHTDLGWDGEEIRPWVSGLVSLRQGQGLRVEVVDVEDIFDEFTYGISTPQAIKDFLTHAYNSWMEPAPQYVLLVGDSTYDYKDNWGLGTVNYVPVYLTFTQYLGETIADDWFVKISGDDAIADMYIGRLPAGSADEALVMVNKIVAYETAPNTKTWEKNILLFSDNQTESYEAVFETMSEDVASLIPTGFNSPFKGYLNDYLVPGDLTAEIKEKINEGTLIVHYAGHASTQIWAHENVFDNGDVADLTNNEKLPFFVSMSCLSGYFGYPDAWDFPSLAEALVRSEGKGAVSAFMPTGMTTPDGQHILDTALFDTIFTEDIRALGPAVSAAKQTLLANGGSHYEEIAETFLLFGDPAMGLKIPLPRRPLGLVAQLQAGGVTLSWQEAKDCNGNPVAGYNLYRSTTPGGSYERLNTSLITGTEYNDTSGETGTTYYYVVTSVDSDGDESVQSQQVSGTLSTTSSESSSGCFISSAAGWMSGKERPLGP